MPDLKRLLLPMVAVASFAPLLATSAEEDRWFKVELMVFKQPPAGETERWPPMPDLHYPGNSLFLIERSQLPLATAPADADKYPVEEPEILAPIEAGVGVVDGTGKEDPEASDVDEDTLLTPTPFALLPKSAREFSNKTAYMRRVGGYRIFFHEAWTQPMVTRSVSPSIILDRSGDEYSWPELQGSVTLSMSRYLHLDTYLWLNTAGDYLSGGWRMPAPPRSPLTKTGPDPELEQNSPAAADLDGQAPAVAAEFDLLQPVYPYRHAVLMRQSRRMRSLEVHYLDHPLLGVIAKLTPLTEEELHAIALDEPGASSGG